MLALIDPAFDPEVGDTVSQVWLDDAVQLIVPPPTFAMVTGCDVGLAPPATAVKFKLVGAAERAGVVGLAPAARAETSAGVIARV